ncbi:MAG TPA: threonine/serine dehydratase [Acidobacteriaceae bacterium]|nr:threonine/serine dehydratase [Acidobacteriaceae bacterium]
MKTLQPENDSQTGLITLDELRAARQRLRGVALHTPLVRMELPFPPGPLWIKAEGLQPIGSFKLRGAFNKVALLPPAERSAGVITYSSGNHAQGVAYAARIMGVKAVIVMPANAPEIKRAATAALGAEIVPVGPSSSERKEKAEELAGSFGYAMVPPYDDRAIIAGQGTCGLEILEDMPEVELILVPVGGGGLLSGISAAVKLSRPDVKVIGVEPELADDAARSFKSGKLLAIGPEQTSRTLADGLRTQSLGVLNFAHLQAYVDDIVTVTEAQIREAMRRSLAVARLVPEPSGAVALAAALFHQDKLPSSRKTVAVMSGGNVEPQVLLSVLQEVVAAR